MHDVQIKDILRIWEENICPITNVKGDVSRKKLKVTKNKVLNGYMREMKNGDVAPQLNK